jgi:CRP/FNR family cyclic AMP-dependent transcriptional regulator
LRATLQYGSIVRSFSQHLLAWRVVLDRTIARDMVDDGVPCAEGHEAGSDRYLLKPLQKPDLDLVMETGRILSYQNRDYLDRQGEIGDGIHVILSGVVETICAGPHGRELLLATWQNGDFVGAPYVLGEHRHSWSARALGRVDALHLDQAAIRRLIAMSPAFAISLIKCLGFKGETYSKMAQTLGSQKVAERLVLLLVKLCENATQDENGSIPLGRITQMNLARMTGATRQSISLILSHLQDEGIISTGPTKLIVNNLAALRRQVGD